MYSEEKEKIRFEDFSVFLNDRQILNRIRFSVYEKTICSLVGPEAGGKTYLLYAINRLLDLEENCRIQGALYVDGHNIYAPRQKPQKLRLKMAMVFQEPNLFPFSIAENIKYVLRLRGISNKSELEDRTIEALRRTGLLREVHDMLDKPASLLEPSQAQRLSVARAVACDADILLLDNPTKLLDAAQTQHLEELFLELKEKHTLVLVTHNLRQAARLSDYTAFLFKGSIIEYLPTNRFFTSPEKEITQKYISGQFG
ncbi:MAG: ATP-binding cassette domain-containing protein [Leptospiraceae bacterium]|nr:ATP-binding cassette domain-containing protein [Leptospiraceae bacterium]MDW8306792.1 ATP-binding cassette domain-containing protein [Leptospiraceae bacterium]